MYGPPTQVFDAADHTMVHTDDGAELAVWALGPIDAEAFILVHGFSLDHTTWAPVAERLVTAGYRVVAADLRGHGRSTLGAAAPTADQLVADLHAVAASLGLRAPHVAGHSLGAVVALAGRVHAKAPFGSITSIAGTEQSVQNPIMKLGAFLFSSPPGIWLLGRQRTGRLMISTWFGKKPGNEALDWIRTLSAGCARDTRVAVTKSTANLDLRSSFAQVGPPTFVLCGRLDKATPLKISERIAAAIAGAELRVIDDAGHMVIIEKPEAVADYLIANLAEGSS